MESDLTDTSSLDAETLLAKMEAEEPPPPLGPDAPGYDSATPGDRAPETAKDTETEPPKTSEPKGEQVEPEPPKKPTETEQPKAAAKPGEQPRDSKGKFAENQRRLEGGWKQVNERKAALDKAESDFKVREQELVKRQQDLERKAEELRRPRVTPEQVESSALTWLDQAQAARDEAKRLEDDGDFAGAESKNREAIIKAEKAREAREYAAHLRANPPKPGPTAADEKAAFEAKQKEWGQKAGIDFPQAFKEGTAEYTALQALLKSDAELSNDPQGIYYAARLISAECGSARALDWKAKFEAADAKAKKLEAKLAIPGGGAATDLSEKPFDQMSEEEQEKALRRDLAGQKSSYVD